ncbi:hypothetical protein VCRA2116O30_30078 [Vibrio crassostreae]|nr:hypothetical protein VCRA2119O45_20219 [Vibrio crassostreae]CAK2057942.1 hypothetical protein VCRA2116O26_30119 [Vibrio crassostreae]CAK2070632.1 hypothetical protein VCRA2116O30_30078 [Vibrio crassostreae]CAK2072357.1 hypothetical protein VCRA2117O39_30096 [Vibrio crassostreae]CAK2073801.1 hypothetical protein VCRA2117O37_30219 [Vibrio crassostreae]
MKFLFHDIPFYALNDAMKLNVHQRRPMAVGFSFVVFECLM